MVQDRSLYEELEDGELPSDDQHRCGSTVGRHLVASPVPQTLNDIPDLERKTIIADSNRLSVTSERETTHEATTDDSQGSVKGTKTSPVLSKTQREILELEMRARAIKAMLKAHEERKRKLALESKLMQTKPK
ncbi:hypothetical protein NP493_500g02002 [Ridgeia piscesae]|uniref:Uncharacterized protein n=1 Tax=Ridgeia piscesae TaxID=27915 RepID=A0AAD9KXQ9_RIDPI|nr:hypothetical protein NP493_500g02002 [Ridgeia piscesae]